MSALVFGGSGAVGREVVRGLRAAGVDTAFTWFRAAETAAALARETGARMLALDLRDAAAIRGALAALDPAPSIFIHCAGVNRRAPLAALTLADWDEAQAINGRAAFIACQALAPGFAALPESHVILLSALDAGQSLPLPIHFAASQGMIPAMAMALARELGPSGTRVNVVALGQLDAGLARELSPGQVAGQRRFAALRRPGTAQEAARVVLWLALENSYLSGKVVPVNGGV